MASSWFRLEMGTVLLNNTTRATKWLVDAERYSLKVYWWYGWVVLVRCVVLWVTSGVHEEVGWSTTGCMLGGLWDYP